MGGFRDLKICGSRAEGAALRRGIALVDQAELAF